MKVFSKRLWLSVFVLLCVCGEAGAVSFSVTTTADTNDGACDAHCSLREAVVASNASASPFPAIILPAGTYTLRLGPAGDASAGSGDLDIRNSLYIYGAGASTTIIESGPAFGDRILDIDPLDNAGPLYVGIKDVAFRNGRAPAGAPGGAILISHGNDRLNMTDCVFTGNATSGAAPGGAIAVGGAVEISDTTFSGNVATGSVGGGAIANLGSGNLKLNRVTFAGNHSFTVGGAIYNGGTLSAANVTFSGNRANDSGGALINNAGSVYFSNVTATLNVADDDNDGSGNGGGVASATPLSIGNSILAGNVDRGGESPDCAGLIDSRDYNLIQEVSNCSVSGATAHNLTGVDPRLDSLADNGGRTMTHLPLMISPALRGGGTVCEPQDQRGFTRVVPCDIGAVEVICGDGRVEADEMCDDANADDTDACRNDCTLPLVLGMIGESMGGNMDDAVEGISGGSTETPQVGAPDEDSGVNDAGESGDSDVRVLPAGPVSGGCSLMRGISE